MEKLLEYYFDVIYCSGKENIVPDFLLRIYLVKLSSPDEIGRDCKIAQSKNKIFPFADRSQLLEKAHLTHTGHLRTAKLFALCQQDVFGWVCLKMWRI